ncbi:MAG: TIGR03545 family protein [Planctomycetota bacterium]
MNRISYLLTRVIILGLLLLAAWVGMDSLVRVAIVNNGQQMTGAKVEIGKVRTSLSAGRIFLQDVRIADPRNPMLNLVQADAAFVDLDPQRLLHREIVIEHGTTHQIMFGAPRTQSGSLTANASVHSDAPFSESESTLNTNEEIETDHPRQAALRWLDSLSLPSTVEGRNLELASVSAEIQQRWPGRFEQKSQEVNQLRRAIEAVRLSMNTREDNPLRDEERFLEANAELGRLQVQLDSLEASLLDFEREAFSDRERLISTKQSDEAAMPVVSTSHSFDSEKLSNVLLMAQQKQHVDDIVEWFRWFRMTVPDPQRDFAPAPIRGRDVTFSGDKPRPGFLIRNLELDGEGQFAGRHFSFSGVAHNITPTPDLHDQPVRIELRAQGKQHLIVDCTLDRRDQVDRDTLYISSPDIDVESNMLGHPLALVVSMGDARMQVDVSLQMIGDDLSGDIIFRYSDVTLFVDRLNDLAGGEDIARRLNQEISTLDQYQTIVSLNGTLDNPGFTFESDLGQQFASALNGLTNERTQTVANDSRQQLEQILSREIEYLDRTVSRNIEQLISALNSEREILNQLERVASEAIRQNRIR